MAQNSEIWHMTIPDFQVLGKNGNQTQEGFWVKIMTKWLRAEKQQKIKSNIILIG